MDMVCPEMGMKITIISLTSSVVTVKKNGYKNYNYIIISISSYGLKKWV